MKALLGLALLAQLTPTSPESLLRSAVSVVTTPAVMEAAAPVEQWLGSKLVIYETAGNIPEAVIAMFPSTPEPGEALITPTAVFVWKGRFAQFRSSFELAEFLSHAAAHARLKHAEAWMDKLAAARVLGTTHAPAELSTQMLERTRKEFEAEAETQATEILGTADCAPGPCAAFGRLLAAVRR